VFFLDLSTTPFPRIALRAGVCAALAAWALPGWAQERALQLRTTPMLAEAVPRDGPVPLFASGERVSGRDQLETMIEGNAELRRPGLTLRADRLTYDEATDLATAKGSVRINSRGNLYLGPEGEIKVESMRGFVLQPSYQFLANG